MPMEKPELTTSTVEGVFAKYAEHLANLAGTKGWDQPASLWAVFMQDAPSALHCPRWYGGTDPFKPHRSVSQVGAAWRTARSPTGGRQEGAWPTCSDGRTSGVCRNGARSNLSSPPAGRCFCHGACGAGSPHMGARRARAPT